jgi:hypothetical protein
MTLSTVCKNITGVVMKETRAAMKEADVAGT